MIETLQGVSPDRRCFRMIGGVLVERTVREVLPALEANRDKVGFGICLAYTELSSSRSSARSMITVFCNMKVALSSAPNPIFELIRAAKKLIFGHLVRFCGDFAHTCAKGATKTPQPALPQKRCKISRSVLFTARKGEKKTGQKISVVGLTRRCNIVTLPLHLNFVFGVLVLVA